ncbi:TetR/AcrR family transcriptional regulator [Acetobacterium woodii]|uniref:Transcriptional regulator TetR family n=1 Tax=Acetobacterium woodii (strain ATCC 29683 / DSM 1030 / JCM 2381 / KCTC 1655 / WB1) TaxID=931626 RepID=H6LK63_ACEWD|nr:TetR/AcrR family transcriptional regulator [Acetobacterium woodii]AFA49983.1 transcriptional regulator TetR family [Acetobacterium woodii DSM 1030]
MSIESFEKIPDQKKVAIIQSGIAEFSKKSYMDASTDEITKNCGISKGILFHYFDNKKNFYLYCLEFALKKLLIDPQRTDQTDFYGIIFSYADEKFKLCQKYPNEMRLVNMAAREMSAKIGEEKNALMIRYMISTRKKSQAIMAKAIATITLKDIDKEKFENAMTLYLGAIINKYLERYQETPALFFEHSAEIKTEIKEYLDFMLNGVLKEGELS